MHELFVKRTGHGPPVLLIHGLLSNHTQLDPLMPALSGRTVYTVDLFGCGQSSKVPSASIVEENAAHLLQVCIEHKIETVIAYSIGGLVALEMQLPKTVFISCFAQSPLSEGPFRALHGREDAIQQYLLKYKDSVHTVLKHLRAKVVPGVSEADMACAVDYMMAARRDYTEYAQKLHKVLCVHGTNDSLINVKLGENLAHAAKAKLVLVPEDHASVLRNETVHHAIREFLHSN